MLCKVRSICSVYSNIVNGNKQFRFIDTDEDKNRLKNRKHTTTKKLENISNTDPTNKPFVNPSVHEG